MTQCLTILTGDCREALNQIPDGAAQCCVTSPPYWGLRSYLRKNHPDKAREIGSEATPEAYVETMVQVFREVRRCLHDSGTLWMNLGDSFFGSGQRNQGSIEAQPEWAQKANRETHKSGLANGSGLKFKDLCMIPWRVALALQADGWWLRSVIVWHKRSCMPESVTDRPTNSWEPIFLLAKNSRYYYDAEAVREPHQDVNGIDRFKGKSGISKEDYETRKWEESCDGSKGNRPPMTMRKREYNPAGRNQRNVWSLGPEPYSEAHFATFPTEIPKRAILAGTSAKGCCPKCFAPWQRVVEKTESPHDGQSKSLYQTGSAANRVALARQAARQRGEEYQSQARTLCWQPGCECNAGEPIPCTVLDPFGGSGTTGQVAIELGRRAVLVELNPEYVDLINGRCSTTMGLPLAV